MDLPAACHHTGRCFHAQFCRTRALFSREFSPLRRLRIGRPKRMARQRSLGATGPSRIWRRGRDLNPRRSSEAPQRFSKPSLSTTQPPLRTIGKWCHYRTDGSGSASPGFCLLPVRFRHARTYRSTGCSKTGRITPSPRRHRPLARADRPRVTAFAHFLSKQRIHPGHLYSNVVQTVQRIKAQKDPSRYLSGAGWEKVREIAQRSCVWPLVSSGPARALRMSSVRSSTVRPVR